jgi:hypothetical protein
MDEILTDKYNNTKMYIDDIWGNIIEVENDLQNNIKQYEALKNSDSIYTEEFKKYVNTKSIIQDIKNEVNICAANIKKNKNEIKMLKQKNIQMARKTGDSSISNDELTNLKIRIISNVRIIEDKEKENDMYNTEMLDKQIKLNSMQIGTHNKVDKKPDNIKMLKNHIKDLQKSKRTLCNNIVEVIYRFMNE